MGSVHSCVIQGELVWAGGRGGPAFVTIMIEFPPYAYGSRSPFWWWCVPSPAQTPRGEPFCPHLCTWPPALALGDVHWFISPSANPGPRVLLCLLLHKPANARCAEHFGSVPALCSSKYPYTSLVIAAGAGKLQGRWACVHCVWLSPRGAGRRVLVPDLWSCPAEAM